MSAAATLLLAGLLGLWGLAYRPYITPRLPEGVSYSGPLALFGDPDFFSTGSISSTNADEDPLLPPEAGAAAPALIPGVHITRPLWQDLPSQQRAILRGLQNGWPYLSNAEKRRWIAIAQKSRQLDASAQNLLAERIAAWQHLSELKRIEIRQIFANRQTEPERADPAAWLAYSQLSDREKKTWADKASGLASAKPASRRTARRPRKLVSIPAASQARAQLANLPKIPLEPVMLHSQAAIPPHVPSSTVTHVRLEAPEPAPASPTQTPSETAGAGLLGNITITPPDPLPPMYEN